MTSGQWVIWQGITQKCPFLLRERINLWKVGRWWSEMPPPTLRKKKTKQNRQRSPWIRANLTLQFSFAITQTRMDTGTGTRARSHTLTLTQSCKHKHTPAQRLALTQIYFLSLFCTHTNTCTHPLGGFTQCPPRCPTSLLRRAHEIWLSCVRLTSILDKANPNLYAVWQAGTLSNANARDTLEVVALCGYFYKLYISLAFLFVEQYCSEPAGGGVCTCFINHSLSLSLPLPSLLVIH